MRFAWVLGLCCLSAFLCGFGQKNAATGGDGLIVLDKRLYKRYAGGYQVNIAYPQIYSSGSEEARQINLTLQRITWVAVEDFVRRLETLQPAEERENPLLTLGYHVYAQKDSLLSIKFFKLVQMPVKGGQEVYMHTTFNYDMTQRKPILFVELFKEGNAYSEKIAKYLNKTYETKYTPDDIAKYSKFCLSENALILSFAHPTLQQLNGQDFFIPWKEIKSVLSEQGIAWRFVP